MMLMRVKLSCPGFPDGRISHGYIDVKVQSSGDAWQAEFEEQDAYNVLFGQVDRLFGCEGHNIRMDVGLLKHEDDPIFDNGKVYAEVISGEGDALTHNPVGKQFYASLTD